MSAIPHFSVNEGDSKFDLVLDLSEKMAENSIDEFTHCEVSVDFHPFDKKVSADCYTMSPFEEIAPTKESELTGLYKRTSDYAGISFGVVTALTAIEIIHLFKPEDFGGVDRLLGVGGAAVGGKEIIWPWVESNLINLTQKNKSFQFRHQPYDFTIKDRTYRDNATFSISQRNHIHPVLPDQFSLIERGFGTEVKAMFLQSTLKDILHANAGKVDIGTIILKSKDDLTRLMDGGFQLTITIKLGSLKKYGLMHTTEWSQSLINHDKNITQGAIKSIPNNNGNKSFTPNIYFLRDMVYLTNRLRFPKGKDYQEGSFITYNTMNLTRLKGNNSETCSYGSIESLIDISSLYTTKF